MFVPVCNNLSHFQKLCGEQGVYSCKGRRKEDFTRIESEGSEPDKAAFLAAARLSTSSAGLQTYIYLSRYIKIYTCSKLIFLQLCLTDQNKYQIAFFLYHFLNLLEKFCHLEKYRNAVTHWTQQNYKFGSCIVYCFVTVRNFTN